MMKIATGAAIAATALMLSLPASAADTGSASQSLTSRIPQIQPLVNVNLRNVLNNLAVRLHISKANVPVTVELPIQVAANVCGVSVNVLAVSAGGNAQCTAKSAPMEVTQAVQQQMAAGGSLGSGSAQVGGNSSTGGIGSGSASVTKPSTSKSG